MSKQTEAVIIPDEVNVYEAADTQLQIASKPNNALLLSVNELREQFADFKFDEAELDYEENPDDFNFVSGKEELEIKGVFAGIQIKVKKDGTMFPLVCIFNPDSGKLDQCYGASKIMQFLTASGLKQGSPIYIKKLRVTGIPGGRSIGEYLIKTTRNAMLKSR